MSIFYSKYRRELDQLLAESHERAAELDVLKLEILNLSDLHEKELKKYEERLELSYKEHRDTINEYKQQLELQKIYCYIITKLIGSSGLLLPENFDITDFAQAYSLYQKFKTGAVEYDE
jgi:hypothetical protein